MTFFFSLYTIDGAMEAQINRTLEHFSVDYKSAAAIQRSKLQLLH